MRTLDCPGVEIKEIDKSGYAPAMTGSKCFVMGYANKGEPYQPMEFTSKAAWQNFYGEPDNEAERYFYNACTEVINQNGVLYCSRIPYDNDAYGKMVGFNFKVGTEPLNVKTANDYIAKNKHVVFHNKNYEHDTLNYIANNCMFRDIEDEKVTEEDKKLNKKKIDEEVSYFFNNAIEVYNPEGSERLNIVYNPILPNKVVSKKVNTLANAKEFLETYSEQGYLTAITKVTTELTSSEWTGDYTAIAYPFEQKIAVEIEDITGTMTTALNLSEDDNWNMNVIKKLHAKTGEITKADAQLIIDFLNSGTTSMKHEFKFEYPGQGGVKEYAIYEADKINGDAISTVSGFDYETFITKTIKELYEEYKDELLARGYTEEEYNEIYFNSKVKSFKELAYKTYNIIFRPTDKTYIVDPSSEKFTNMVDMCEFYNNNAKITVKMLIDNYGCESSEVKAYCHYYQLREGDDTVDKYFQITPGGEPICYDLTAIDEYRTGEAKFTANQFLIVDKTCATLKSIVEDKRKGGERQMIGIFPVVTTAANALYAQNLITVDDEDVPDYESVTSTITKDYNGYSEGFSLTLDDIVKKYSNKEVVESKEFKDGEASLIETVSREANGYFSSIQMNSTQTGFDTENLKKIGVVVFKAYLDASEGNKVNFTPVESFVGSLNKDAKNPTTGATTFLDTIVNAQSEYIYFFSNCFATKTLKAKLDETDIFIAKPGRVGMLGFYSYETLEEMSLPTLYQGMDKCLQKVEDINERDIDIIPDAGLANIAQYLFAMKSVWGARIPYDIDATDEDGNPMVKYWTCNKNSDVGAWKTVLQKLDNFCKNVRKDCMFIADGPRPMVLQGQKKIVRPSKPSNTIDANILPYVKWATGLNTNYGAGYLDWFEVADEFTGDNFWCPPSIKAMGVYINTDVNHNYWDAPAGLNRGVVAALDVAFSPTVKQAGSIYTKNWNYAINYPYDGIVLEGQKTFQVKPSAFDRVNVRRLFLRLERQTYKVARYFVYEGNTAYTRQRLIDTLDPIFQQAKVGGGLYDYKIICDESINTPNVIDNNELKVKIGLKPVKTAEFILIDFIALSTGGSFSEL